MTEIGGRPPRVVARSVTSERPGYYALRQLPRRDTRALLNRVEDKGGALLLPPSRRVGPRSHSGLRHPVGEEDASPRCRARRRVPRPPCSAPVFYGRRSCRRRRTVQPFSAGRNRRRGRAALPVSSRFLLRDVLLGLEIPLCDGPKQHLRVRYVLPQPARDLLDRENVPLDNLRGALGDRACSFRSSMYLRTTSRAFSFPLAKHELPMQRTISFFSPAPFITVASSK